MLFAACSSDSSDDKTLNGSGSSFQAAYDEAAISAFTQAHPGVTINYGGGGSGKGKTDLQSKTVDFAGTDSTIKPEEKAAYQGGDVLYFPTVAAPITVSFNVTGVDTLKLSPQTLGGIFSRHDQEVERPRDRPGEPRCRPAVDEHHCCASRRGIGHHEQLHQVPDCRGGQRLDPRER